LFFCTYPANRTVEILLPKEEEGSWEKLQKGGKLKWLSVDWSKWVDSDEEGEEFNQEGEK
jgi:cytosolic prostaglandin-E synthase